MSTRLVWTMAIALAAAAPTVMVRQTAVAEDPTPAGHQYVVVVSGMT